MKNIYQDFFAMATQALPVNSEDPRLNILNIKNNSVAGMNVYNNAYFFRLRDVLREQYAMVFENLGDKAFDELVLEYLEAFPPSHASVSMAGNFLPEFIAKTQKDFPENTEELALFYDLAVFELLLNNIVDEKACYNFVSATVLGEVSDDQWPQLKVILSEPIHVKNSTTDVLAVKNKKNSNQEIQEFYYSVSCVAGDLQWHDLSKLEAELLSHLKTNGFIFKFLEERGWLENELMIQKAMEILIGFFSKNYIKEIKISNAAI